MSRLFVAFVPLLALACADGSSGPDGTDDGVDTNNPNDTGQNTDGTHPLVPEEFKYLWITDEPCQRRRGPVDDAGVQVEAAMLRPGLHVLAARARGIGVVLEGAPDQGVGRAGAELCPDQRGGPGNGRARH